MINIHLMIPSFSTKSWRAKRKNQYGCTPGCIPCVLDMQDERWLGNRAGLVYFWETASEVCCVEVNDSPKGRILGRIIRGYFAERLGLPFVFGETGAAGRLLPSCDPDSENRSRPAETLLFSSLFLPETGSMVLHIYYALRPQLYWTATCPIQFFPWCSLTSLGKAISSTALVNWISKAYVTCSCEFVIDSFCSWQHWQVKPSSLNRQADSLQSELIHWITVQWLTLHSHKDVEWLLPLFPK